MLRPREGAAGRSALRAARWGLLARATVLLVIPVIGPVLTGTQWIVVEGGSMAPTARYGDVIVVAELDRADRGAGADVPDAGEIVTASRSEGSLVTHRIVGVDEAGRVELRGDANSGSDRVPVAPGQMVGRVEAVIGAPWSLPLRAATRLAGKAVLLGVLVFLLVGPWSDRRRESRQLTDDEGLR